MAAQAQISALVHTGKTEQSELRKTWKRRELQVQGTFHVKHQQEPWPTPHEFDEVAIAPPHTESRGEPRDCSM